VTSQASRSVQIGGYRVSYDCWAVTFGNETQLPDLASQVQGRSATFDSPSSMPSSARDDVTGNFLV